PKNSDSDSEIGDALKTFVGTIANEKLLDVSSVGIKFSDESEAMAKYANLVRASTTEIGCAMEECDYYGDIYVTSYCVTNQSPVAAGDYISGPACALEEDEKEDDILPTIRKYRGQLQNGLQQNGYDGEMLPAASDMQTLGVANWKQARIALTSGEQCLQGDHVADFENALKDKAGIFQGTSTTSTTKRPSSTSPSTKKSTTPCPTYPHTTSNTTTPKTTKPKRSTTPCPTYPTTKKPKTTTPCPTLPPSARAKREARANYTSFIKEKALFPKAELDDKGICADIFMTNTLRTRFLELPQTRAGKYLSQARNMFKLRYDCKLEEKAALYASQCPERRSRASTREGDGENFLRIRDDVGDFENAVNATVSVWWRGAKRFGALNPPILINSHHFGPRLFSFSQMAWATTRYIGCSIVKCSSSYVSFCRYQPR
ncbi:unnamed protein product, partial [Cylicocyclus nassatus]